MNLSNIKSREELIRFLVQIRSIIWRSGGIYKTRILSGRYRGSIGYFQGMYVDKGGIDISSVIRTLGITNHRDINNEVRKRLKLFEK